MTFRWRPPGWVIVAGIPLAAVCAGGQLEAASTRSVRKPLVRPAMTVFYISPNGKDSWSGRRPDPRDTC
jgi:hypothetical protein